MNKFVNKVTHKTEHVLLIDSIIIVVVLNVL